MIRKFLALAVLIITSGPATAQTPVAPSQNCAPTRATPGDNGIATTGSPNQPLTEKLAQSDGVLCPPPSGDAQIRVPAPDAGASKMPVVPPPGSPGGDPSVRPK